MPILFFTSWETWQQMTFVLAMAIVAVFCAGLGKLWWNNRLTKKQEVLDEEKRARLEVMRKTGLPIKRANNVPFGVRAIQSGIEVDGIWISRPASLNETVTSKLASSATLAGRDSDVHKKRRDYSKDEKSVLVTTTSLDRVVPSKQSTPPVLMPQKLTNSNFTESAQPAAAPVSQFANKTRGPSSRPVPPLHEDTLRRLEGRMSVGRPPYETYTPMTTSPRQNPCRPAGSQRNSASSSQESVESQPRSVNTASGRSYASSDSSRLYMAARTLNPHGAGGGRPGVHDPAGTAGTAARCDPFETPARTPSGFSAFSQSGSLQQQQGQEVMVMAASEPSFGSGELNLNKVSRTVQ